MELSQLPSQLVEAWATGDSTKTSPIPVPSQQGTTPGAASWVDGFPPLCGTPVASGGIPPSKADMNGALYQMSAVDVWMCAGGGFPYNATFSATIGGYPKGARVLMANGNGYWVSTVDNNTTDPDTGGAGWASADENAITALTGDVTAAGPGSAAATVNWPSPGAIGNTKPNTGAFTTLTANTPPAGDDSTKAATTAWVTTLVGAQAVFAGSQTSGSLTMGSVVINWVQGAQTASNAGENTTQTLSWYTPMSVVYGFAVSTVVASMNVNMDVAWQAVGLPGVDSIEVYMNIFNETSTATTAPYVLAIGKI